MEGDGGHFDRLSDRSREWEVDKKVVILHYSYKKHSTMKNIRNYALLALLLIARGVMLDNGKSYMDKVVKE